MFIVMCRVSGGVTGTRTAPLKSNGEVSEFATREEAQVECDRLISEVSEYSVAKFEYWPVERV